jgi:hypothetical protein
MKTLNDELQPSISNSARIVFNEPRIAPILGEIIREFGATEIFAGVLLPVFDGREKGLPNLVKRRKRLL